MSVIPLTKLQKEIMREFYSYSPLKVIYNKKERKKIMGYCIFKTRYKS